MIEQHSSLTVINSFFIQFFHIWAQYQLNTNQLLDYKTQSLESNDDKVTLCVYKLSVPQVLAPITPIAKQYIYLPALLQQGAAATK